MNRYQKYFIAITILFYSGTSDAQEKSRSNKNLLLGFNLSADYCYRKLINNSDTDANNAQAVIDSRNSDESPRLGWTSGINCIYQIDQHLGVELGLQYAKRGYRRVIVPFPDMTIIYLYDYKYIDLPLRLNYSMGTENMQYTTCAGFAAHYFIAETIKSKSQNMMAPPTQYNSEDPYRKLYYSVLAGGGLQYNKNHHAFRFELLGKYGIRKIIDTPVSAKLWSLGINTTYLIALN